MTFEELLSEVNKIKCEEKRGETPDYLEVVVGKAEWGKLTDILSSYWGQAFKPEGASPSREADLYSKDFGGIQKNQTMYFRKNGNGCELALVWPWGSGNSLTAKLIRKSS
ncbi:MAG: hypothetical protein HQL16_02590 [Candidatus Omnitrophica bacterium]|nr:hypothetical protein [Candidatus Omnitrophota bacterium]